jgi:hypothetical protein
MIGTHDTMTYLDARSPLVHLFPGLWRTQSKGILEQYRAGVRFFDFRVFRDGHLWRMAHGVAEFDVTYSTLQALAKDVMKLLPGSRFRIWLEKGSDADWVQFTKEGDALAQHYKWALTQLVRKNPEIIYYRCPDYPDMVDLSFRDWNWKTVLYGLFRSPIRRWAKTHNIDPTMEQRSDRNTIYFMDFV